MYVLQWARLCHCCFNGDNYDDFVKPFSSDHDTVILVRDGPPTTVYDVFKLRCAGSLGVCVLFPCLGAALQTICLWIGQAWKVGY